FQGPLAVSQFKGGQSNPTYRLDAGSGSYVLRRKPPGELLPTAHAVDREFRVQQALGRTGFPVPHVHALESDERVIGSMFYVMDFTLGRVIWEPHMPDAEPVERRAVYDAMNRTIADLHTIDPDAVGLGDFGRAEGYVARQVRRWTTQYQASTETPLAEMDRLIAWLPDNLPPDGPARIVHGDYRLDNLILAPEENRVAAVIDWELSTLGDPLADFTYHLMQWHMPASRTGAGTGSLVGHDLAALGIPTMDAYIATYEERTGFSVMPHLPVYFAYNFFRMAAILAGIVARARAGSAANENARLMEGEVRPLAETAWTFAQQAGS
ncbi:MAG TPA: phosphotransferase family protein, partial [Afifellaceae bacterium]|nr:phosphotransferase family protein [Afifellaceae bacterium]